MTFMNVSCSVGTLISLDSNETHVTIDLVNETPPCGDALARMENPLPHTHAHSRAHARTYHTHTHTRAQRERERETHPRPKKNDD